MSYPVADTSLINQNRLKQKQLVYDLANLARENEMLMTKGLFYFPSN